MRVLSALLACGAASCTPLVRQFDLKNQPLTCKQAIEYAFRTLQAMGFTVTGFERAAIGRPGALHGTREERGSRQNVTVEIACDGRTANVLASEDGIVLGRIDFERGFYLSFTSIVWQAGLTAVAAREEAARPLPEKKQKGLRVLLEPVRGLAAMLDFDMDLAAAGVLPVRVTIANATPRTYTLDPADVVLVQKDGTRVHPLSAADAAERVATAERQKAATESAAPDRTAATQRLQAQLFTAHSVSANQTLQGYLFFPLGQYTKGRVSLEDQESEETEGFVVEF